MTAEKTLIYNALTIGLNSTYTDVNAEGYEGAIVVAVSTDPEKAATVANYNIQPVAGTYKILGAAYTIVAKPKTITYGDEYTMDDFEYFTNGADVAAGQKVTFKLYKNGVEKTMPTDAGTYDIKIVPNDAYLPTGYTLPITYVDEEFTILPKELTATLQDQTLMVGDNSSALVKTMVSFLDEDDENGVVGDDVIGFKLQFNSGNEEGQITADENVYTKDEADEENKSLDGALDWSVWTVGNNFTAEQATAYNTAIRPSSAVTASTQIAASHITAAKNYNATLENHKSAGDPKNTYSAHGINPVTEVLTTASEGWAKGIKIVADNTVANNKNSNYTIDWSATAKLTVLANNSLVLNGTDNDLTNIEKIAASANATVPVTLNLNPRTQTPQTSDDSGTERKWAAQKWNTMVLPFDIEVADLSQKLGYAVVNVLDKENTTGTKVAFKLWMGKIDANTPFTVKTAKKLIKETGDADGTYVSETGVINFGDQEIKAPTAAQKAGADAGNGCLFVPVYQTKTIDNTQQLLRFLMGDGEKWGRVTNAGVKWNVVPFAAYIDLTGAGENASEMIFTFEEADGSTTAVKAIDVDFVDASVKKSNTEGWYTLNGVRLQSAPTQKGVYIKNGKKVIVK